MHTYRTLPINPWHAHPAIAEQQSWLRHAVLSNRIRECFLTLTAAFGMPVKQYQSCPSQIKHVLQQHDPKHTCCNLPMGLTSLCGQSVIHMLPAKIRTCRFANTMSATTPLLVLRKGTAASLYAPGRYRTA
jgi:hypothetical protein